MKRPMERADLGAVLPPGSLCSGTTGQGLVRPWRIGTRPDSSLRDIGSCSGLPGGKDLQFTKGSSGRKLERGAGILALARKHGSFHRPLASGSHCPNI